MLEQYKLKNNFMPTVKPWAMTLKKKLKISYFVILNSLVIVSLCLSIVLFSPLVTYYYLLLVAKATLIIFGTSTILLD